MMSVPISLLQALRGFARSRAALHLEVLALRHQLQVLQRSQPRRVRLANADRWLWAWLSRSWLAWRTALVIVKPEPSSLGIDRASAGSGGGRVVAASVDRPSRPTSAR